MLKMYNVMYKMWYLHKQSCTYGNSLSVLVDYITRTRTTMLVMAYLPWISLPREIALYNWKSLLVESMTWVSIGIAKIPFNTIFFIVRHLFRGIGLLKIRQIALKMKLKWILIGSISTSPSLWNYISSNLFSRQFNIQPIK